MTKIKPRVLPRSILDILICLPAAIVQALILFILPMLVIYLLTDNSILALCVFLSVWGFFLIGGVRYLLVDENGIALRRVIGSPKFIAWEELESVEISSPINTIIHGWLWPPIPAREMTYSLSAYEHMQFTYDGSKRVFFPPKQPEELVTLISKYKANTLTRTP